MVRLDRAIQLNKESSARVYPAVKRGLGLAKDCTRVKVGSDEVWVKRAE